MRGWKFFFGAILVSLLFVGPASANNVTIALTATFQGSVDGVAPGVVKYATRKVRITQKDVLALLGTVYPLPTEGASLYYAIDGSFYILNAEGNAFLYTVSPSVLTITLITPWIRNGVTDSNPGGAMTKIRNFSDGNFTMNIDGNNSFALAGLFDLNYAETPISANYLYKLTVLGHGEFDGGICTLSGKAQIKIRVL